LSISRTRRGGREDVISDQPGKNFGAARVLVSTRGEWETASCNLSQLPIAKVSQRVKGKKERKRINCRELSKTPGDEVPDSRKKRATLCENQGGICSNRRGRPGKEKRGVMGPN